MQNTLQSTIPTHEEPYRRSNGKHFESYVRMKVAMDLLDHSAPADFLPRIASAKICGSEPTIAPRQHEESRGETDEKRRSLLKLGFLRAAEAAIGKQWEISPETQSRNGGSRSIPSLSMRGQSGV
ncbi:hypothetical protein GW17_00032035 [Ensete ventricosum]|nr:hypothetical protein GW17_00032035 [Ensete ventricosum]